MSGRPSRVASLRPVVIEHVPEAQGSPVLAPPLGETIAPEVSPEVEPESVQEAAPVPVKPKTTRKSHTSRKAATAPEAAPETAPEGSPDAPADAEAQIAARAAAMIIPALAEATSYSLARTVRTHTVVTTKVDTELWTYVNSLIKQDLLPPGIDRMALIDAGVRTVLASVGLLDPGQPIPKIRPGGIDTPGESQ